jgi:hypothetical protein
MQSLINDMKVQCGVITYIAGKHGILGINREFTRKNRRVDD